MRAPGRVNGPRVRRLGTAGLCLALAVGVGCASPPDRFETFNRGIFAFNEAADRWVVRPVARGWDWVLPDRAETAIDDFFENLRMPVYFGNNLLQGKPDRAAIEVLRFILNSTFGLAGFIDVAEWAGWPHFREDFGLTMGHWGIPEGPYLVLPIFGPSTVRDTVGLAGDAAMQPQSWLLVFPTSFAVGAGTRTVDLLNRRAIYDEEIEQARQEAFDFYVFARSAYLQNRRSRLAGEETSGAPPWAAGRAESEEDLYFFDEEFDEELDEDSDGEELEDSGGGADDEG